tara:strand:- start:1387 stop:1833 length:447 start_codon:yes stop_codon:yes gene_type:complete
MSFLVPWGRSRRSTPATFNSSDWSTQVERAFGDIFDDGFFVQPRTRNVGPQSYVATDDTEHRISIAMPGVPKDAVSVNVSERTLTVGYEASGTTYNEATFATSFTKTWTLPDAVDVESITASAEDGILTITVPRTEAKASTGRTITIE